MISIRFILTILLAFGPVGLCLEQAQPQMDCCTSSCPMTDHRPPTPDSKNPLPCTPTSCAAMCFCYLIPDNRLQISFDTYEILFSYDPLNIASYAAEIWHPPQA